MNNELGTTEELAAGEWSDHGLKHTVPPGTDWARAVRLTEGRNPAVYHPSISRQQWMSLEIETVKRENEIQTKRPNVRAFYRYVLPEELEHGGCLGASCGEETNWIYVERAENPQRTVHGRPITESDLKRKGAFRNASNSS